MRTVCIERGLQRDGVGGWRATSWLEGTREGLGEAHLLSGFDSFPLQNIRLQDTCCGR